MSRIDTNKIEGYADMTAEEKLEALENFEIDHKGYIDKKLFDKTASELASYKKQLREKMSADEIKAKEDADRLETLQNNYNDLLKKVAISENKAKFIGLGYDDKMADETAQAISEGNLEVVFANQKKFIESVEKKVRADVLKDTPKPDGGNSKVEVTKEQFDKMDYDEREKLFSDNQELYNKLNGGN